MADKKQYRLILVDDEPWALIGMKECINWENAGFRIVAECDCGEAALEAAHCFNPDAVITDIRMPDMSGLDLVKQLREMRPSIQCVVVSAFSDFEMAREAIRLMAVGYLLKPLQEKEVQETAERLYTLLNEENEEHETVTESYTEISAEHPKHPEIPVSVRYLWLAIHEQPLIHALWKKDCWCQAFRTAQYYGMFCDALPEEIPSNTGISCAIGREDDIRKLFHTAEASMNGGFLYPPMAGIKNSSTVAARIQYYLYEHLAENITLKELSEEFFLTETYLCDLFKQETGRTILGFLKEIRIHRAETLLRTTDDTITEIAAKCGYNDYSYFGRHFKSVCGTTPDHYRKNRS